MRAVQQVMIVIKGSNVQVQDDHADEIICLMLVIHLVVMDIQRYNKWDLP
jgi:hypothetical protein